MKTDEYLDWVLDYYRGEVPGISDAAIYEVMVNELGPKSPATVLMAARMTADIHIPIPNLRRQNPEDPFYMSFEWRRVRMSVLERDGAKCVCCGRTADDGIKINVDHIKSRKRFPQLALDPANLQVLCDECNHGKGNRYSTDWRQPRGEASV